MGIKLLEQLNEEITSLTKSQDVTKKKDILKGLKCKLQLSQKKSSTPLTHLDEIDILKKEIKERYTNLADIKVQSRVEYLQMLRFEIEVLSKYLPKYINEEETESIVDTVLAEYQLSMKKDFKKAIGLVIGDREDIDKNIVSKLLQKKLV